MLYFSTKTGNGGRGAEGVRQGAIPNARHHRFSVSCKLRILRKANGCAGSSAVGALLRKGEGGGGVMRALRIGMGFTALVSTLVWMLSPYAASAQQDQTNQTCSLQSDYEILKKFYESTGGGVTWDFDPKTWNMNLSPSQVNRNNLSSFEGVTVSYPGAPDCPSTSGCVDELDIWAGDWNTSGDMTGTLPPEMSDFCGLTYLDLGAQKLTGPIPANISNNKKLYYVDIQSNKLSGTIPSGLLSSENMEEVYLQSNNLTGTLPPNQEFGRYLGTLYIGANEMEGELPESIVNSQLTDFDWSDQPACLPDNAKTRNWFNSSNVYGVWGHLCHTWKSKFEEPITLTWDANQYAAYALPEINQPVTVVKWGSPPDYYDDYFTYGLTESNLPAGLQFNPDPPSLSGTPTAEYSQKFRVTYFVNIAEDWGLNPTYWIKEGVDVLIEVLVPMKLEGVNAKTLTKGAAIGPEGELPAATGGWPEYTYDLSPKDSLPAGVSFTTAPSADEKTMTGWLQGTPTEAMDPTPFKYTATDREGTSRTKELILSVRSVFQLQRPAGQIDTVFVEGRTIEDSLRLPEAIDGSGDYSYWTEEDLPEGLIQSWSGREIGGTPAGPSDRQEYTYVAYDNASGDDDVMSYWLTVAARLAFPDTLLDDSLFTFEVGTPIRPLEFADAIGGLERAYAFGPDLPPGLSFDMGTPYDGKSTIKGTPTEPWSPVWYTYRVADASSSQVDSLHFGIEVVEAFALARPTDRYYTVGVPVSDVVAGARGGTSHSYAVDKGLPPGLALDAPAGRIHGTPTGMFPRTKYAWSVTDASLGTKRQDLFLAVDPRLALPDARRYTFLLDERQAETLPEPTGGRPGYTYAVEGLPDWLGFDATTRMLEGEPSVAMDWRRYDYIATDSVGRRDTMALHIRAVEALRLSRRVEDQEYMVGVPSSYQFPLCRNCEAGADISYALLAPTGFSARGTHLLRGDPYAQWHADLGHARRVGTPMLWRIGSTDREIGEDFTMVVYDVLRLVSRVDTLSLRGW